MPEDDHCPWSVKMTTKAFRYVGNGCFLLLLCRDCIRNALFGSSLPVSFPISETYLYKLNPFYAPSRIERFALEHSVALNYHVTLPDDPTRKKGNASPPRACDMWKRSPLLISEYLQFFKEEMATYNQLLQSHPGVDEDVRHGWNASCQDLHIHPQGLGGVFTSGSLSRSFTALLEPIYPPFASLSHTCSRFRLWRSHHDLDFLVHDFSSICQDLKPTSKIVLVDVGYDLKSKWGKIHDSTTLALLRLYKKFGFHVDAIYVFDSLPTTTTSLEDQQPWTSQIYQIHNWDSQLHPRTIEPLSTHDEHSNIERKNHPWDWITHKFGKDDLILVTLHLPPRHVDPTKEMQLLEEIPSSPVAHIMDAIYFHPTVYMAEDELQHSRKKTSTEEEKTSFRWTVREALLFFTKLREKGIHAHAFVS